MESRKPTYIDGILTNKPPVEDTISSVDHIHESPVNPYDFPISNFLQ